MVTLDDIAKEVGVSKVTVSNALRGKTNVSKEMTARITQVARSMHYRIGARSIAARNLKTQDTQIQGPISIIVPTGNDIWIHEFVQHCITACTHAGRQAIVEYVDVQEQFEVDQLANQVADGMIIAHSTLPNTTLQELVTHRPTVCIDRLAGGRDVDAVLTDSVRGMQNGIEYLVTSGKRKILLLDQIAQQAIPTDQFHARIQSAIATLQQLNVPFDASNVISIEQHRSAAANAIAELGTTVMQYDAIACASDDVAFGVLYALHQQSLRIPQDIAVLGFGGTDLGMYYTPQLTSIDTHIEKIARTAVQLLLDRLQDEDAWMPTTKTVPSTIALRASAQPGKLDQSRYAKAAGNAQLYTPSCLHNGDGPN